MFPRAVTRLTEAAITDDLASSRLNGPPKAGRTGSIPVAACREVSLPTRVVVRESSEPKFSKANAVVLELEYRLG